MLTLEALQNAAPWAQWKPISNARGAVDETFSAQVGVVNETFMAQVMDIRSNLAVMKLANGQYVAHSRNEFFTAHSDLSLFLYRLPIELHQRHGFIIFGQAPTIELVTACLPDGSHPWVWWMYQYNSGIVPVKCYVAHKPTGATLFYVGPNKRDVVDPQDVRWKGPCLFLK